MADKKKWKPYLGTERQREREGRLARAQTEEERLRIIKEYQPGQVKDETEGARRLQSKAKKRAKRNVG